MSACWGKSMFWRESCIGSAQKKNRTSEMPPGQYAVSSSDPKQMAEGK